MIVLFIIVPVIVLFLAGFIKGLANSPPDETNEQDELHEIHKQERIEILDETIIKYNKLLDNLNEQYKTTWNENERSKILIKQISTMEKLNKALEKREKLDD